MNRDALQTLLQNREPGLMDATGRYAVLVPLAQGPKGPSLLYAHNQLHPCQLQIS